MGLGGKGDGKMQEATGPKHRPQQKKAKREPQGARAGCLVREGSMLQVPHVEEAEFSVSGDG